MGIEHIEVPDGAGTANVAVDVVGTDNYQLVKIVLGADGVLDNIVDAGAQANTASIPVTHSTEDLAVHTAIKTAVELIDNAIAGTEMQVDVVSAPAVRALTNADIVTAELSATDNAVLDAAVTALQIIDDWDASDHCNIRHLVAADDIVALGAGTAEIGKLAAGTANIGKLTDDQKMDLNKVAGASVAVSNGTAATSLRVTIASDSTGQVALAAGTASIGKLGTANSGVDIGDVDILSVVPGVAATNLGKAEDAAHTSGDVGVMALAVRLDAPAATAAASGYTPLLTDIEGRLYVNPQPGVRWSAFHDIAGGAHSAVALQAAPAGALCLYVTDVVFTNDATLATSFKLIEDTAGGATAKTPIMYIPASGGIVINYVTPLKFTANKDLGFTTTGTANSSIEVRGFTA